MYEGNDKDHEDHHRGDHHMRGEDHHRGEDHMRGERPEHHEEEGDDRRGPCHGRRHCKVMKIVGLFFFLFKMSHLYNLSNLHKAH